MVTKVSLFISTTETEQKTSEQKRSRYCVALSSPAIIESETQL